jgi:hypothetical protein
MSHGIVPFIFVLYISSIEGTFPMLNDKPVDEKRGFRRFLNITLVQYNGKNA